jgi:hypothetical protein
MILYAYVLCLRILVLSRISQYDLEKRTPHFWGDSIPTRQTDQDLRTLPEITTEKTLSSHLIIQPSFENSGPSFTWYSVQLPTQIWYNCKQHKFPSLNGWC